MTDRTACRDAIREPDPERTWPLFRDSGEPRTHVTRRTDVVMTLVSVWVSQPRHLGLISRTRSPARRTSPCG
ncbi:MAG: hypothetical protein OJJ54_05010 [Pseudonocardia sp.]|nr:hypothetical protein [Pseudonocardia sp.]